MTEKIIKILIVSILVSFALFVSIAHCYIVSDGSTNHQVVSMSNLTTNQILQQAQLNTRKEDVLNTENGTTLYTGKITISRAKPVQVEIDGKTSTYYTTTEIIGDLIKEEGIKLNNKDYISPSIDSLIGDQKIVIKTYVEKEKIVNVPIDYKVVYSNDSRVAKGLIVKVNNGKGGILAKYYKEIYFGGQKIKEVFQYDKVARAPVNQVYLVGTAELPQKYLKLYTMRSTAYSPTVAQTDSNPWVTASGLRSSFGIVAIDPKIIPLGSLLYVEGYGYAVAGDTGGLIKGDRIDVFFYSTTQSNKWGVRNVKVYLLPGKWEFNKTLSY